MVINNNVVESEKQIESCFYFYFQIIISVLKENKPQTTRILINKYYSTGFYPSIQYPQLMWAKSILRLLFVVILYIESLGWTEIPAT